MSREEGGNGKVKSNPGNKRNQVLKPPYKVARITGEEDKGQTVKRKQVYLKSPYIHEEIIINIFSRIPITILWRNFMYHCKKWSDLIQDAIANVNRNPKQGITFLEKAEDKKAYVMRFMEFEGPEVIKVHELHRFKSKLYIFASTNGFLLGYYNKQYQVINPITKKAITLSSPREHDYFWHQLMFFLDTMEWKVVQLFKNSIGKKNTVVLHVHNSDGSSKQIQMPTLYKPGYEVVSLGRVSYWNSDTEGIASFDTSSETFGLIRWPGDYDSVITADFKLIELGGSIAFVQFVVFRERQIKIWIWKDNNLRGWLQLVSINQHQVSEERGFYPKKIIGSLDNGNLIVLHNASDKICVYNVKTKGWTLRSYKRWGSCSSPVVHVNRITI